MSSKAPRPGAVRDRLLAAADELFYGEGVNSVGIDRIIERAGVAKASLYSAFGSKDALVHSYLDGRHAVLETRISTRLAGDFPTPGERLLAVFDVIGEQFAQPGFRGCAHVNASAEAQPGSSVEAASDQARQWVRALFNELSRDVSAHRPEELARQLILLYDGASVVARMDRDPGAGTAARAAAAILIDAAVAEPGSSRSG